MRNPLSFMQDRRREHHTNYGPKVDPPKARRSIREALTDVLGKDAFDKATSPSTQMSLALGQKPVYAGTVAKATIARRRAANKRARVARRVHRRAVR